MNAPLPRPTNGVNSDYINRLVAALELSLGRRAKKTNGVVLVTTEQPLVIMSPNGTLYRVEVTDSGELVTTETSL